MAFSCAAVSPSLIAREKTLMSSASSGPNIYAPRILPSAPVMILAPGWVSPSLYYENQPEVSVKLTATSPTSCASFSSIPTRAAPVQE